MCRFLSILIIIAYSFINNTSFAIEQNTRDAMPQIKDNYGLITFSEIRSSDNTLLNVAKTGNPSGPHILFIHGFSQSYLSWEGQLQSSLKNKFSLTAFDIRGHGSSGKPTDPSAYQSTKLWADDLASVIREMNLKKPVLVGWSWAGFIIMNYVRHYGIEEISGINLVGANTSLQGPIPPPPPKPGQDTTWLRKMTSPNIQESLEGAVSLIDLLTNKPIASDQRLPNIVANMMTPYYVKKAMLGYPSDNSDLAKKITVPVLLSHGTEDLIVSYKGLEKVLNILPNAELSTYENVGHSPFIEEIERFNKELAEFVINCM